MFRFGQPQYLYLFLVWALLIAAHYYTNFTRMKKLKKFGDPELLKELMPHVSPLRREIKFWFLAIAIAMMILTVARPQMGAATQTVKRQGIEAIIAIDVSNSMMARDVTPSRLERAKMLVSNIVDNMVDDKIGLVVYAGDAFTQLPITSDYVSAKMFLETISPEMIGTQGTDIKKAITLASRSFTQNTEVSKALFVITDGEDNEGGAVEAAQEAAKRGIITYMLGIGSPQGAPIPDGTTGKYITDNNGVVVVSKLNESMCREIAAAGNGAYIYVDNGMSAQRKLSEYVDKLATSEIESISMSDYDEQFQSVALLALLFLLLDMMLLERKNDITRFLKTFKP